MRIQYEPTGINNFHNSSGINLIVSGELSISKMGTDEQCYKISISQAKRIEKHFCGMKDCHCSKGATIIQDIDRDYKVTEYGILCKWCNCI